MENSNVQVGQVVLSKQGRDKGSHFIIVKVIDDNFVLIADGKIRKIDNPKLKKLKHLKVEPHILVKLRNKILDETQIFDNEIRSGLKAFDTKISKGEE